jgi:hypothetical protein
MLEQAQAAKSMFICTGDCNHVSIVSIHGFKADGTHPGLRYVADLSSHHL